MKNIILAFVILLNVFVSNYSETVQNINPRYDLGHGFTYETDYFEENEEKTEKIRKNLDSLLLLSYEEPEIKNSVSSFDVSENGRIAVSLPSKEILVYNKEMKFEYSVAFEGISGAYGVLWAGEHLALLSVRSDQAYVLSDSGELLAVYKINAENNKNYWDKIVCPEERIIGEKHYYIANKCPIQTGEYMTAYEELVLSDSNGIEKTLYKADEARYERNKAEVRSTVLFAAAMGVGVLVLIYFKLCKNKNMNSN